MITQTTNNIAENSKIRGDIMSGFLKLFFVHLLKIVLVALGIGCGLYLAFEVIIRLYPLDSPQAQPEPQMIWWLIPLFGVIGFLLSVAALFMIEYRGRLSVWSLFRENLLMLVGLACIAICIVFGIAVGFAGGMAQGDEHGFIIFALAFLGSVISILPGIILGALVTAIWKFRRDGKNIKAEKIIGLP